MKLLTLTQVAHLLGISVSTAHKISPELPGAVALGKRIKFRLEAIEQFVRDGGTKAAA